MAKEKRRILPVVGWREWLALPEMGINAIKAKVDTGARSSSLHAVEIEDFTRNGMPWVRFRVQPYQRRKTTTAPIEMEVLEYRSVRSSNGKTSVRPVVVTHVTLLNATWPVELTLASRAKMGFRMLLGREAVRGRFYIDPGSSYYNGKPQRQKRQPRNDDHQTRT